MRDEDRPAWAPPMAPPPEVDLSRYIGLTEQEAIIMAAKDGLRVRVLRRDDFAYFQTLDYNVRRISIELRNGRVSDVPELG